jgi:hypothetical protein
MIMPWERYKKILDKFIGLIYTKFIGKRRSKKKFKRGAFMLAKKVNRIFDINKRYFSFIAISVFGFMLVNLLTANPLLAKKRMRKAPVNEYSSKYYIEDTYPFVTAADWYAVHLAFKSAAKSKKAELTLEFAKRLDGLEKAKENKKEEKKDEMKPEKNEEEGK